jgi:hypothetical protein
MLTMREYRNRGIQRECTLENWPHFDACLAKTLVKLRRRFTGMKRWVGFGVIADNLVNIGRALAPQLR